MKETLNLLLVRSSMATNCTPCAILRQRRLGSAITAALAFTDTRSDFVVVAAGAAAFKSLQSKYLLY